MRTYYTKVFILKAMIGISNVHINVLKIPIELFKNLIFNFCDFIKQLIISNNKDIISNTTNIKTPYLNKKNKTCVSKLFMLSKYSSMIITLLNCAIFVY